jgi:hypothetical protein
MLCWREPCEALKLLRASTGLGYLSNALGSVHATVTDSGAPTCNLQSTRVPPWKPAFTFVRAVGGSKKFCTLA